MSTQGAGMAEVTGAVAAGAFVVVAGTGMLIVNGVMWCGEQLEKHYQNALREWEDVRTRARAEQMRTIETAYQLALERSAQASQEMARYLPLRGGERATEVPPAPAADIAQAARALQTQVSDAHALLAQREQEQARFALQMSVEDARGLVAPNVLAAAERALTGTPAEQRAAREGLVAAVAASRDAAVRHTFAQRAIAQQLAGVAAQMRVTPTSPQGEASRAAIATLHATASAALARDDLPTAQRAIDEAQSVQQQLTAQLSAANAAQWSQVQARLSVLRGKLDGLTRILADARQIQLIDAAPLAALETRVGQSRAEVEALLREAPATDARSSELAGMRINLLEHDVFAATKGAQQGQLGTTIAQTLDELGYRTTDGGRVVAQASGGALHIDAVPPSASDPARAGRLVTFDVSLDALVSYDFQGYVGATCEDDARVIFAALRKRGVLLRDTRSGAEIHEAVQNKRQSRLYTRLKEALERMHFTHVDEHFMSGMIELDAFNGDVGYRITLSPDETVAPEIQRDGRDVSTNSEDAVVASLRHATAEVPQAAPIATRANQPPQRQTLEQ